MDWLPDLSRRRAIPERMDDPSCDPNQLERTLDAFHWSNRLISRYRTILRRWIIADMLADPHRDYRLVDLGAGGCDIAVWLLRASREQGLRLSVLAVDNHPTAAAYARRRYGSMPGLQIIEANALDVNAWAPVDYVWGNHFLHHLADDAIVQFLQRLKQTRWRRFVFSDLVRRYHAYYVHSLISPLLFPGTFMTVDGQVSLQRAFTVPEMRTLLDQAGFSDQASIHTLGSARIVIVGSGDAG